MTFCSAKVGSINNIQVINNFRERTRVPPWRHAEVLLHPCGDLTRSTSRIASRRPDRLTIERVGLQFEWLVMAIAQRASTDTVGDTNYVEQNTYRPPPPPGFLRKMIVLLRLSCDVSAIRSLIALPFDYLPLLLHH